MGFRVGGEAEETQQSISGLLASFVLAVFGITGVVIAFALHGQSLSFLGMLGVVGMAGWRRGCRYFSAALRERGEPMEDSSLTISFWKDAAGSR